MLREKALTNEEYYRICRALNISNMLPKKVCFKERVRIIRKYENTKLTPEIKKQIRAEYD